jgi:hypothetical protein
MAETNGRLRDFVTRGRARHAELCIDAGTATRVTGHTLTAAGGYTDTLTTVYTGPCRVKREQADEQVAGDTERSAVRTVLVLPWDEPASGDLRKGDRFTVTATGDDRLQDRDLVVIGPAPGTTSSARRYLVEEVTA